MLIKGLEATKVSPCVVTPSAARGVSLGIGPTGSRTSSRFHEPPSELRHFGRHDSWPVAFTGAAGMLPLFRSFRPRFRDWFLISSTPYTTRLSRIGAWLYLLWRTPGILSQPKRFELRFGIRFLTCASPLLACSLRQGTLRDFQCSRPVFKISFRRSNKTGSIVSIISMPKC